MAMEHLTKEEAQEAVRLIVQAEIDDETNMYKGQGKGYMVTIMDWMYKYGFVLKELK